MVQKIIIFGFAHSGTTILKSIFGHIEQVKEIHQEQKLIRNDQLETDKKYVVCKWPDVLPQFLNDLRYRDYIKIFIIRNPLWVFSSLNRRDNSKMLSKYNISKYIQCAKLFYQFSQQQQSINSLHTIKYEELFDDNFKSLKNIFDKIGFQYQPIIFDNSLYTNICNQKGINIPQNKPDEKKHGHFRKWQINQPFSNMNVPSKIELSEYQKKEILSSEIIQQIYPDIRDYLSD